MNNVRKFMLYLSAVSNQKQVLKMTDFEIYYPYITAHTLKGEVWLSLQKEINI